MKSAFKKGMHKKFEENNIPNRRPLKSVKQRLSEKTLL